MSTSLQSLNIELLSTAAGNDSLFAQADADFTFSGSTLDIAGKTFGLAGFESLSLEGGDSDNAFVVDDWNGSLSLDGGAGNDTLQQNSLANATWTVSGANSGEVNGKTFSGIENLVGVEGNQDQFVFEATGSISGTIDGGAAGFDTLVLNGGNFETVSYIAMNANSGEVRRDADVIRYFGLEPIVDNTV